MDPSRRSRRGRGHLRFRSEGLWTAADRVFAGGTDGSLYALNAETGGVEWKTNLGAPITSSVRVSGASLYVGTFDGNLHRVDARNGAISASRKVHSNLKPRDFPVVTGESILVLLADEGADNRAIVSLDLNLNGVRWRQIAENHWSTTRLFVLGNAAIVGTRSGDVTAYCVQDGSRAWSSTIGGTIRAIGGSEDTLYIGTAEGDVSAVRPVLSCKPR